MWTFGFLARFSGFLNIIILLNQTVGKKMTPHPVNPTKDIKIETMIQVHPRSVQDNRHNG